MDKKDIKNLQSTLKSAEGGHNLLNRTHRISLKKMEEIIKQNDPKLALKLKTGYTNYHKKVKSDLDEIAKTNLKHSRLEKNIKKTRKYDTKHERSVEYMKERLSEQKTKGLSSSNSEAEHTDKHGKYHILDRATTSARRPNKWEQDSDAKIDKSKQKSVSIDELKESAKNLPDLPI
ncbi:MAG: hypothetical protein GY793_06250 [Proteobacteria bacterium]|nr:hypothetical protein [Pseudomonadota bacterium]